MFQYAAGRAFALRRGRPLALDISYLGRHRTPRDYELGCFDVHASLDGGMPVSFLKRFFGGDPVYREPGFAFDASLSNVWDRSYLIGYFQSARYFTDHAEEIRRDFQFVAEPDRRNADLLREIEASPSVAVHVRRGDYVSDATTHAVHGVLDLDYYRAAVDRIRIRQPNPRIYVFSDDLEWCKQHLSLRCAMSFMDHNAGKGFEDLRLMSRCRHHIIANSSFSWWGAWLNPDADRIVVGPKRWFADSTRNTSDLYPPGWLVL